MMMLALASAFKAQRVKQHSAERRARIGTHVAEHWTDIRRDSAVPYDALAPIRDVNGLRRRGNRSFAGERHDKVIFELRPNGVKGIAFLLGEVPFIKLEFLKDGVSEALGIFLATLHVYAHLEEPSDHWFDLGGRLVETLGHLSNKHGDTCHDAEVLQRSHEIGALPLRKGEERL